MNRVIRITGTGNIKVETGHDTSDDDDFRYRQAVRNGF